MGKLTQKQRFFFFNGKKNEWNYKFNEWIGWMRVDYSKASERASNQPASQPTQKS